MQQQLQQYFVLHTYFQAYGEKIPISEITLLLKNHQIWQYFKKGCQIGRQQWRMRQRLIEENRPLLPAFSTARPTWKLSSYIFHQIFSGKKGSLHNGPILHQFKIHIITMQYILHIAPFISYKGVQYSPLFGRRDLKITCKCLPGWWGK